ncbi:hypothetical protein BVX98_01860 [bacterium F11]|nr:hypothetical protein BVX98_01860 [bacterium F11]
MDFKDKVVVITGASSGIGKELALQLSRKGSRLVLVARTKQVLDDLAQRIDPKGEQAIAVQADVSKRNHHSKIVEQTLQRFGRLDVYINNAGVSLAQGTLMENREEDVRDTLEINFMSAIYSVWAAVPIMEKGGGGQLVFVSSCIGKRGVPLNAVYCSSKFAMQGLTESIRPELRRKNIRVITLCPPGVNTPFFKNNKKGHVRTHQLHSVEKIGRQIVRALEKEKREVLLTFDSKALHWLNVFFPRMMDWALARNKKI